MYAGARVAEGQRRIYALDRGKTCGIRLDEVERFRHAGRNIDAVLAGSRRNLQHPSGPECCCGQAQRPIKTVATLDMRAQILDLILYRNDRVFPVIRQMAADGLACILGHGCSTPSAIFGT
jgi:hypothetical protein